MYTHALMVDLSCLYSIMTQEKQTTSNVSTVVYCSIAVGTT